MNTKKCGYCGIEFQRSDDSPTPHDRCERCHARIEDEVIESLPKQARYQDDKGEDWIDEFARTTTPEEFRGAMKFTVGKYLRRAGKKDSMLSEVRKMRDYCQRWEQYEQELEQ